MASFNSVTLLGNITRDLEIKYLPSGSAVVDIGLAVNNRIKRGDQWVDEACFVDCAAFGHTAENCAKYLGKGSQVLISGRLRYETWEKDGVKRSKLKVTADEVVFVGKKAEPVGAPAGDDSEYF